MDVEIAQLRLECLRLACSQATVSPLYFAHSDAQTALDHGERWSAIAAEEVLALAQKYSDFLEKGSERPA